jgi:hypothetical protein
MTHFILLGLITIIILEMKCTYDYGFLLTMEKLFNGKIFQSPQCYRLATSETLHRM